MKIICERLLLAYATFNFLGTTWRVKGPGWKPMSHVCMYVCMYVYKTMYVKLLQICKLCLYSVNTIIFGVNCVTRRVKLTRNVLFNSWASFYCLARKQ